MTKNSISFVRCGHLFDDAGIEFIDTRELDDGK